MALEDGQAVTTDPANMVTGVPLTDGTSYGVQNTRSVRVYYIERSSKPNVRDVEPQYIEPGDDIEYTVDDSTPMWVWTTAGVGHLGLALSG